MSKKDNKISDSEKKKEDWMNSKWRPAMGWMYMVVCIFDFIIAPIGWTIVQFWETQAANDAFRQWQPLTLSGAGLFHMAMGAVLGLSAWGRTQEKLGGANNGGLGGSLPGVAGGTTPMAGSFGAPTPTMSNAGYNPQPAAAWSNSPVPMSQPSITTGWGGKKAPTEPMYPEI